MDFSLKGKIAVVTGARQGLGLGIALALAKAGADIVGVGRDDMDDVKAQVEQLGRKFCAIEADFAKINEVESSAQKALAAFGKVDILVNNAGVTPIYPAEEYPENEYDRVMDVNVKALYFFTQTIGKAMIKQKYGRIINIASVQSVKGGNNVSAYVATKHAVAGITRAFANEWGKHGITVNAIAPGYMATDNTAKLRTQTDVVKAITAQIPVGRWGTPEDLQGPAVFLASDASAYVNGHLLIVDGGYMNA